MPRSQITIRDVASHAGVSHQTVSRVINNSSQVSPKTRDKVMAAIDELGYSPNAVARSMARGRTCMLACISPNLTDYTFSSIIEGAEQEARKLGYFLVSSSAPDEESFSALLPELIDSRRVEGLVVINPYADARHSLLRAKTPTVFVGSHSRLETISSVALDDFGVAKNATQHLLNLGHKRIAMVTGPRVEDCTTDRNKGYLSALDEAWIKYDESIVVVGDWSATSGYEALYHFSQGGALPTAVFAQNDRMAIGVLRAAREREIQVPEQLSVIGIDDLPLASYFDPPLTTMQQDMHGIGREAVRLLINALEDPSLASQHVRIPAKLIVRGSTNQCTSNGSIHRKEVVPGI